MACRNCRHKRELARRRLAERRQQQGLPSLPQMAKNLTLSVIEVIKHAGKTGELMASTDTIKNRIDICKTCENIMSKNRCKICGCFLNAKAGLAAEKCPIDKW